MVILLGKAWTDAYRLTHTQNREISPAQQRY
jgi:hypothetical protein